MPPVPLNYVAIAAAAVANMILGSLWYGPLFGKTWMKLSGISMGHMNAEMKKQITISYTIMAIGSVVMAFVMAHSMVFAMSYLEITGVSAGVQGGFWNWLGFVAPVTVGTVIWEGKPWKLWFINAGFYLVSLIVMGIILALWQ